LDLSAHACLANFCASAEKFSDNSDIRRRQLITCGVVVVVARLGSEGANRLASPVDVEPSSMRIVSLLPSTPWSRRR